MTKRTTALPFRPGCWEETLPGFLACHRDRLNVAIHLLTIHLGSWALMALLARAGQALPITAAAAWLLFLTRVLPPGIWWANAASTGLLLWTALAWPVDLPWLLVAIAAAYGLQDLAHVVTHVHRNRREHRARGNALQPLDANVRDRERAGTRRRQSQQNREECRQPLVNQVPEDCSRRAQMHH
jgi:hypothetical protein